MHDTGVAESLVLAAERAAGNGRHVRRMTVHTGPLSGLRTESLCLHVEELALARWGRAPEVIVESGVEMSGPRAFGATLVSIVMGD